jgi:hypothetical protein
VGSLHFKMLIYNELQTRHYKRSEETPVILSEAKELT